MVGVPQVQVVVVAVVVVTTHSVVVVVVALVVVLVVSDIWVGVDSMRAVVVHFVVVVVVDAGQVGNVESKLGAPDLEGPAPFIGQHCLTFHSRGWQSKLQDVADAFAFCKLERVCRASDVKPTGHGETKFKKSQSIVCWLLVVGAKLFNGLAVDRALCHEELGMGHCE